jgi:hypothetical protein
MSNQTCSLSCDYHELMIELGPAPAAFLVITIVCTCIIFATLLGVAILNSARPRSQVILQISDLIAGDDRQPRSRAYQYRALRALLQRPPPAYDPEDGDLSLPAYEEDLPPAYELSELPPSYEAVYVMSPDVERQFSLVVEA